MTDKSTEEIVEEILDAVKKAAEPYIGQKPDPIKIKTEFADKFEIAGRGTVIAVNKNDYPGVIFKVGMNILYGCTLYTITGIELFRKLCYPSKLGDNIGLRVRKIGDLHLDDQEG